MKFLLHHRYKRIGAIIAPLGFAFWLFMQLGYVTNFLTYVFGKPEIGSADSAYHLLNIVIAIISFFSFLGGIYLVSFSKEKIEDEMVQRTRLDSFQFAALVQIIAIMGGFVFMFFAGDPGEGGMMLYFIVLVFLFWLTFISRFNYILHVKLRQ